MRACTSVVKPRCSMSWGGFSLLIAGTFKPSCCLLAGEGMTRRGSIRCKEFISLILLASMLSHAAEGVLKDNNLRCRAWKSAFWRSG